MAITKVTTDGIDMSSNSGGLTWAKGTTAEQPGSPVAGELRENTETAKTEVYDGTEWKNLKEVIPTITVDYLVVAGGGGAGWDNGAGGGAGGLRTSYQTNSGGGASAETLLTLDLSTN